MSLNRYENDTVVRDGRILGTNQAIIRIRDGVNTGAISVASRILQEGERLDVIANELYGDGRLWWIIAAASEIGWWLQAPAGTRIVYPQNISEVEAVL